MDVDPVAFAKALADNTRQRIMKMLCCEWLSVGDVVEGLVESGDRVSQPTVSHHLAILRDAGLVLVRSEGKHTFYTLNQSKVALCCGNLIEVFAPQSDAAGRITGGAAASE